MVQKYLCVVYILYSIFLENFFELFILKSVLHEIHHKSLLKMDEVISVKVHVGRKRIMMGSQKASRSY